MSFPFYDTGLSTGIRQLLYLGAYIIASIWLKHVTARLRPGSQRLVSSVPLLIMNIVLPFIWSTDELLPRTNAILVNSWLSSFKVRQYATRPTARTQLVLLPPHPPTPNPPPIHHALSSCVSGMASSCTAYFSRHT